MAISTAPRRLGGHAHRGHLFQLTDSGGYATLHQLCPALGTTAGGRPGGGAGPGMRRQLSYGNTETNGGERRWARCSNSPRRTTAFTNRAYSFTATNQPLDERVDPGKDGNSSFYGWATYFARCEQRGRGVPAHPDGCGTQLFIASPAGAGTEGGGRDRRRCWQGSDRQLLAPPRSAVPPTTAPSTG